MQNMSSARLKNRSSCSRRASARGPGRFRMPTRDSISSSVVGLAHLAREELEDASTRRRAGSSRSRRGGRRGRRSTRAESSGPRRRPGSRRAGRSATPGRADRRPARTWLHASAFRTPRTGPPAAARSRSSAARWRSSRRSRGRRAPSRDRRRSPAGCGASLPRSSPNRPGHAPRRIRPPGASRRASQPLHARRSARLVHPDRRRDVVIRHARA